MAMPSEFIKLQSSDDVIFEVDIPVALEMQTIKNLLEGKILDAPIPILYVKSEILGKVIEYCEVHAYAHKFSEEKRKVDDDILLDLISSTDEELKTFDSELVKADAATLFDLISAANLLDIKSLSDLATQAVADMMKNKTPEEIGQTLKIVNDFSPEEIAKQHRDNPWAFEKKSSG